MITIARLRRQCDRVRPCRGISHPASDAWRLRFRHRPVELDGGRNAARAGAQYVNVNGPSSYTTSGNSCGTPSNTFTCAIKSATSLGTNVTVSVGNAYCGCQSGTTYTTETFSPPCNVCNTIYTSNCCPAGQTPVTLAQVNASYTYTPIFGYLGFGPSNGFNLTAQATALLY